MPVQILTKEDLELLQQALNDAKVLRKELERAKLAGIDVSDIERELNEAEARIANLQRVYGVRRVSR